VPVDLERKRIPWLRLLLWLKLTLVWRNYRGSRVKVVSAILFFLLFIPISVVACCVIWWLLSEAPEGLIRPIARDASAVVFLIWIATPLLGFQMNESYDVTKLFAYPLGYRTIFAASVVGNLLDPSSLLVLPPLIVLGVAFATSTAGAVINALAIILFLGLTLAVSQAVTLSLAGFLRSRRFRDITIVVLPMIGVCYYVAQQTIVRQWAMMAPDRIIDALPWHLADWLPPGYLASALAASRSGHPLAAIPWLLLLGAGLVVTLAFAAAVLKSLYLGDAGQRSGSSAEAPAEGGSSAGLGRVFGRLPTDIAAVCVKELVYFVRDPQYKAMAVQTLYTMVVMIIPVIAPRSGLRSLMWSVFQQSGLLWIQVVLLLAMAPIIFNIFGGEGAGISVLLSLPTRRRSLLLGKNLAHGLVAMLFIGIAMLITAGFTHRWEDLPVMLIGMVAAVPVMLATGNLISVRLPHRLMLRGQRWQRGAVTSANANSGCAFGVIYGLAALCAYAALVPVAAAVIVPAVAGSPEWIYLITLPLALVYSTSLYVILLGQAERWMLAREPEIAQRVMPTD
jgi:ABC-2 type transport system permease protein